MLESYAQGGNGRRPTAAELGSGCQHRAYARKLTKTPWDLSRSDYKVLEQDLGPARAMATFWWLCRGLYMTRVSDGFQLPLERDNVFQDFYSKKPSAAK